MTAVLPFVLAIVLRVVLGRNRMTRTLLSASTIWFLVNVLLAPYSARMQQELQNMEHLIR
ncbi:MAG: hypothetical protein LAQ69_20455 [Acidobacteriia bacterium]|nr:hypothetical protein [Terriglobia bacterium]